jgi:hypothetical protein
LILLEWGVKSYLKRERMCGRKIKIPTIAANIATSKTIPAETSLAIFASNLCSFTKRFITSSIEVLIISAEITNTISNPIPNISYLVNPKIKPAMTAKNAAKM